MLDFVVGLPALPLAQSTDEWWVSTWLTPIWFLAVGIAFGLIALAIVMLLLKLLSNISAWEQLSRSPMGHVVAAVITAVLFAIVWTQLPPAAKGSSELQEPLLLGVGLALCCAIAGWAVVFGSNKQAARESFGTITEGAPGYLLACALGIVAIGGAVWACGLASIPIVVNPQRALASIPQLFSSGERTYRFDIAGRPADGDAELVPVDLPIDFELLASLSVSSNVRVLLADAADSSQFDRVPVEVPAEGEVNWTRSQKIDELPVPFEEGTQLHIQNREIDPAEVVVVAFTNPPVPEATTFVVSAIVVLLVGLAILLQRAVAPRVSAVAHATVKNELAQPLFLVLMALGVCLILLFEFLPFYTFGEDIKILKDCGITTIMLIAAFQGVWSASSSVSEEIEGKTALTVLSKPIQRRSFVIGKFLGIFWVLFLIFVVLGTLELGAVSYKPLYDAKESSEQGANWQLSHLEMISTIPGLAMAFMQSVVLTAISVALATRIPQLANLSVCFAIYVVGNLTTSLVSSTQEGFEIVRFVAQLIATIIPILEHFSLQAAIDAGSPITMSLLSGNLIYCLLYVMLAMFLALLLFEDRDLA
ncbi:MAG TPA: ABC transporter permease [Planctomycetaceae bacterium]|nr:ABC transporter permease [Planctomycetaceae bacterium]